VPCIVSNLKAEIDKQMVVFALLKKFLRTPTGRHNCTSKNLGDLFIKEFTLTMDRILIVLLNIFRQILKCKRGT